MNQITYNYQGSQASLASIILISQNFAPSHPPPRYLIPCQDEPLTSRASLGSKNLKLGDVIYDWSLGQQPLELVLAVDEDGLQGQLDAVVAQLGQGGQQRVVGMVGALKCKCCKYEH